MSQKMTQDDKGGGGVWNTLKKDDVIYEQPLNKNAHYVEKRVVHVSKKHWSDKREDYGRTLKKETCIKIIMLS